MPNNYLEPGSAQAEAHEVLTVLIEEVEGFREDLLRIKYIIDASTDSEATGITDGILEFMEVEGFPIMKNVLMEYIRPKR